ncbi:hypothetical protein [Telmatospirillum sp. J64-1]|uniref:hypothetical protein n=1 Tax=Telmatospirillum sp. J64-1 TaxID=2502183 RepID=UPI00115EECC1|nr:hypothetical protein [Telmatospirillum sp. J64-1]
MATTETFEGYVLDIARLRATAKQDWLQRARAHTRDSLLEEGCADSGYALVAEDGSAVLLDPDATPKVVARVRESRHPHGIRLRARRADEGGAMHTLDIEEVDETTPRHGRKWDPWGPDDAEH